MSNCSIGGAASLHLFKHSHGKDAIALTAHQGPLPPFYHADVLQALLVMVLKPSFDSMDPQRTSVANGTVKHADSGRR